VQLATRKRRFQKRKKNEPYRQQAKGENAKSQKQKILVLVALNTNH
jgi:hypothetical protein